MLSTHFGAQPLWWNPWADTRLPWRQTSRLAPPSNLGDVLLSYYMYSVLVEVFYCCLFLNRVFVFFQEKEEQHSETFRELRVATGQAGVALRSLHTHLGTQLSLLENSGGLPAAS